MVTVVTVTRFVLKSFGGFNRFSYFCNVTGELLVTDMTTEEIKRLIDDERAEQLTAQLCRHWEVATQRLAELAQDMEAQMDTCVEAEIYAAVMRMQSAVMAIMELNKMPCAYLFSGYLKRINEAVSNDSIRQSVMALVQRMLGKPADSKRA